MQDSMPCQECTPETRRGCPRCGGWGVVLQLLGCTAFYCDRMGWFQPGPVADFDGKVTESFDGLKLIHRDGGSFCVDCDKLRQTPQQESCDE